ncbi:MAG: hypothetical protein MI922_06615, partial [Bacteroidales bacterium]|nr:hypothetical protein [Bacteroidales bacterium]
WEPSLQAKFLKPMATSLAFGILFATVITLILIPSIYLIIYDFVELIRKVLGKKKEDFVLSDKSLSQA